MGVDKRGISRGECKKCTECDEFEADNASGSVFCGYCGHRPVEHINTEEQEEPSWKKNKNREQ